MAENYGDYFRLNGDCFSFLARSLKYKSLFQRLHKYFFPVLFGCDTFKAFKELGEI